MPGPVRFSRLIIPARLAILCLDISSLFWAVVAFFNARFLHQAIPVGEVTSQQLESLLNARLYKSGHLYKLNSLVNPGSIRFNEYYELIKPYDHGICPYCRIQNQNARKLQITQSRKLKNHIMIKVF
jgi:hypothetical protein